MRPEIINSLKGYKKKDLLSDIMSGLMVAIIALPLSIALGLQSGATLQQGIITAIIAGFFISALGGSRFQIGGPTAAFVAIVVGYINDPKIGFAGLQAATICAGILMILMGIFKLGRVIKFVPYPVVIGFTAGIGITLMAGQLKDFFGFQIPGGAGHDFISKIMQYGMNFLSLNIPTVLVGVFALLLIIFIPKINKRIPAAFVAIVLSTLLVALFSVFDPNSLNVATIGSTYGDIKASFSFIDFSVFGSLNFGNIIVPAIVIAFLASIESLLSATVADGMANTRHDSNMELVGQGVANIMSSCFMGLPATGAIARTAANIKNGAKSSLSGVFHAVFLLLMFLLLMPVVKYIPLVSLAAVLIMVAVSMCNFKLVFVVLKTGYKDATILAVTFALTVVFDLVYGVIGGMAATVIFLGVDMLKKTTFVRVREFSSYGSYINKIRENVTGYIVSGRLTFANVTKLAEKCEARLRKYDGVVLDLRGVERIDSSSSHKLAEIKKQAAMSGKEIYLISDDIKLTKEFERFETLGH